MKCEQKFFILTYVFVRVLLFKTGYRLMLIMGSPYKPCRKFPRDAQRVYVTEQ